LCLTCVCAETSPVHGQRRSRALQGKKKEWNRPCLTTVRSRAPARRGWSPYGLNTPCGGNVRLDKVGRACNGTRHRPRPLVFLTASGQLHGTGKRIPWCLDPSNVALSRPQATLRVPAGFGLSLVSQGSTETIRRTRHQLLPGGTSLPASAGEVADDCPSTLRARRPNSSVENRLIRDSFPSDR
jgi:hypothetical protein